MPLTLKEDEKRVIFHSLRETMVESKFDGFRVDAKNLLELLASNPDCKHWYIFTDEEVKKFE